MKASDKNHFQNQDAYFTLLSLIEKLFPLITTNPSWWFG